MLVIIPINQEVKTDSNLWEHVLPDSSFCGDYTDDYTDDYTMINSHSGNIFSREAVRGVRDQHAGLPHRPVPHHDTPVQNNI